MKIKQRKIEKKINAKMETITRKNENGMKIKNGKLKNK